MRAVSWHTRVSCEACCVMASAWAHHKVQEGPQPRPLAPKHQLAKHVHQPVSKVQIALLPLPLLPLHHTQHTRG